MNTVQIIGTLFVVLTFVVLFGGFYWLSKRTK
jgi:preprotein translocase subunit SecE